MEAQDGRHDGETMTEERPEASPAAGESNVDCFVRETCEALRMLRKSRGKTLQDVADMLGTTPQTIQRIETNGMTGSLEWVGKICFALGMDPRKLMFHQPRYNPRTIIRASLMVENAMDHLNKLHSHLLEAEGVDE